jgi:hypothetical protein
MTGITYAFNKLRQQVLLVKNTSQSYHKDFGE